MLIIVEDYNKKIIIKSYNFEKSCEIEKNSIRKKKNSKIHDYIEKNKKYFS